MHQTQNFVFILSFSIAIAFMVHGASSVDLHALSADRVKCQSTYFPNLTVALASFPKAEVELNKAFNNGTCQIQCLLKTGSKNFQTMPQITAADYVPCKLGNAATSKTKTYCFNGSCLTPAQISALLP